MSQGMDQGAAGGDGTRGVVGARSMEIVVGAVLMLVAAIVMFDSRRLGAGWGSDGPQSGYFPFFVGLVLFVSGAVNVALALRTPAGHGGIFVERGQLRTVLQVLVPTVIYVVAIAFIGLYVASAVFIAYFMWRLGGYRGATVPSVAILVPLALFMMFEVWFRVPLPKGPLETALGF